MGKLLTVAELAEYLRLTKRTIYRLLERRAVPAVKVGHKWRFDEELIEKWLRPDMGGDKKCILIIDDDPFIGLLFKQALGDSRYTIVAAATSDEGIEYAERLDFDLIFIDLAMAKNDGVEVLRRIKDIKPGARINVITAYPDSETINKALAYGPFNIIKKPSSSEDIVALVGGYSH